MPSKWKRFWETVRAYTANEEPREEPADPPEWVIAHNAARLLDEYTRAWEKLVLDRAANLAKEGTTAGIPRITKDHIAQAAYEFWPPLVTRMR